MALGPVQLSDVQAIYAIPDGVVASAFIDQANVMMNQWLSVLPYPTDYLYIMQTYLVVHLMQMFEPQTISYAGMRIAEQGYGKFLQSTEYGQRLLLMDTNGYLSGFGKRKARMFAL